MTDAERYQFIKQCLVQMHTPKIDGQHSWHMRPTYTTGLTFDDAIDKAAKVMQWEPAPPEE